MSAVDDVMQHVIGSWNLWCGEVEHHASNTSLNFTQLSASIHMMHMIPFILMISIRLFFFNFIFNQFFYITFIHPLNRDIVPFRYCEVF